MLPLNRHQAFSPDGCATHAPVPIRYSTVFEVELPAWSVALTVKGCQPGEVASSAPDPARSQLATPE